MSEFIHVGLTVSDLNRSVDWYNTYFGFKEIKRFEKEVLEIKAAAVISLGAAQIELIQPQSPMSMDAPNGSLIEALRPKGANHIAIGVDDIEECYLQLTKNGARMITEIMGGKMFFCEDPDGTVIEVKRI